METTLNDRLIAITTNLLWVACALNALSLYTTLTQVSRTVSSLAGGAG